MRRRSRVLVAVVAVILFVFLVIAGYIYASIYTSSPVQSQLEIIAEDHAGPSFAETDVMILCPNRVREMGLCDTGERDLHAKYVLTVSPPPIARDPAVTCKVFLGPELERPSLGEPRAMIDVEITAVDKSSDFTCTHTRIGEDEFELDLTFVGDPDDVGLMARYILSVTVDYDEPLLSWMPLFTREVSGVNTGEVCLLGYDIGKYPSPGTRKSEKPLGEFCMCGAAVFWQRQMLGLEPSCEICVSQFFDNSYVTVHVVDVYGKPIEGVAVSLNTTSCCWIDRMDGIVGRDLIWTGEYVSQTTDSDGNAGFLVTPYTRYTVMIEGLVLSEITAPPPTVSTTITVTLT